MDWRRKTVLTASPPGRLPIIRTSHIVTHNDSERDEGEEYSHERCNSNNEQLITVPPSPPFVVGCRCLNSVAAQAQGPVAVIFDLPPSSPFRIDVSLALVSEVVETRFYSCLSFSPNRANHPASSDNVLS